MHAPWLNRSQRVVLVVGFGVALYIFGLWLSTPNFPANTGWVGYAPLTSSFGHTSLSNGADLILWFVLIAVWVSASSYLLRTRPSSRDEN
ncbi:MAG: hypothetical protein PXZ08_01325 [Actinomycetota bacterium]|nr:hypothetical protein [Actinomycetota bacterium]